MTPAECFKKFNEAIEKGNGKDFYEVNRDSRPLIIKQAERYATEHAAVAEFSDCSTPEQRINRSLYLHSIGKIVFK